MLEITNYRNGQIVNRNHGTETAQSLTVTVEGLADCAGRVLLNGQPVTACGRCFHGNVTLTDQFNRVTVSADTPRGEYTQTITLVWDKQAFARYNFYIDDHSFVFTDIAREKPKSAFDHFYFKALQDIHNRYGTKFTLNCFYRNDHDEFYLRDFPDTYKEEFRANADWLRFSFHSYSEFPDRPYLESGAEEFGHDYELIRSEIERFAGAEAWIEPVVIHWANVHPAVAQYLVEHGCRAYSRSYRPRVMGGPSLAQRQGTASGIDLAQKTDAAFESYYDDGEEKSFLDDQRAFYNPTLGVFFFSGHCCCNLTPIPVIEERTRKVLEQSKRTGQLVYGLASHEQYSFPYYPNYIPDHLERIEIACRLMYEAGCKPVFFAKGLLGNEVWERTS
ncbi:MAG: hypothetical protein ACOXZM_08395 [Eubacteriales bacterium]|jgi:hypothetical protein